MTVSHASHPSRRSHRGPDGPRAALRTAVAALALPLVVGLLAVSAPTAAAGVPAEDYAGYDGQRWCAKAVKPGTQQLQDWTLRRFGGGRGPTMRRCKAGGRSEHKEGRAFDWTVDANRGADRERVRRWLANVLATRPAGEHAKARRMGIMYVIWNDRIWRSYDRFRVAPYRPCKRVRRCSKTARHRDHVHVSLSRPGALGETSWYERWSARR